MRGFGCGSPYETYDGKMAEVLGAIAAAMAIVGGFATGARWLLKKGRERKALKAENARAGLPPPEQPYPARLTCREETDFHPGSGYHEGLVFEVFNESDQPVTVKGFGLDIT